jgi:hypothetical protein
VHMALILSGVPLAGECSSSRLVGDSRYAITGLACKVHLLTSTSDPASLQKSVRLPFVCVHCVLPSTAALLHPVRM